MTPAHRSIRGAATALVAASHGFPSGRQPRTPPRVQDRLRSSKVESRGSGVTTPARDTLLVGGRVPNLDPIAPNRQPPVFTLLHDARPVLLNLGEPGGFDVTPWAHRVSATHAEFVGSWGVPVLGHVAARVAVLIRPDGIIDAVVGLVKRHAEETSARPAAANAERKHGSSMSWRDVARLTRRTERSVRAGGTMDRKARAIDGSSAAIGVGSRSGGASGGRGSLALRGG